MAKIYCVARIIEISAIAFEFTAQLYPLFNRLYEFDAGGLAFVMRRDWPIEELFDACDEWIQEVSKRTGEGQRRGIRKLWKTKSLKNNAKNGRAGMAFIGVNASVRVSSQAISWT